MMTAALILVALIAIALIVRSHRQSPFVDDTKTVPMTDAQRMERFDDAARAAWGKDTEERLRLHAKGSAVKRRMLIESRNCTGKGLAKLKNATNPPEEAQVQVVRRKLKLMR